VQFIKSLFCWHGFDNRQRFICIIMSCLMAFIIFNESLNDFKLSTIVILLLCTSASLASTRRRLHDAQLQKNWILAPAGSFLTAGLFIVFIEHSASYWLLLLPLLLALLLLTYPSRQLRNYILGYNGPVDLTEFQLTEKVKPRNNQRVEPTMDGLNIPPASTAEISRSSVAHNVNATHSITNNAPSTNAQNKDDIGEAIRLALFSQKNSRVTIAVISALFILALLISTIFSRPTATEKPPEQTIETAEITSPFQHQIALPDNFSLMMSSDQALVVNWQADVEGNQEVWSLGSATGDKKCQSIVFNNKQEIRTFRVHVMDNSYFAYFSPLDTKSLIKNLAFKSNFTLCGYNFSLKGSQAALGKSNFYANLIEY
jgi:uncharacterized membrane protein YhaH (DUF805 family)